jgi:hypothetical protein
MLRRIFLAAAIALAGLFAATLAQALSQRHVGETVKLAELSQSSTYPQPGSSAVSAGSVSGTIGNGATLQTAHITGHPDPKTYTFTGTAKTFYTDGEATSSIKGTAKLESGGNIHLSGHGRYTGGTSSFKHASGKYTFSGTIPPPNQSKPTPAVIHVSGTISR